MTTDDMIDAAFDRAEAAFERAIAQALSAREADFQKFAEQVLGDLAALAIEWILAGAGRDDVQGLSGSAISAAIAQAAASGGRFL